MISFVWISYVLNVAKSIANVPLCCAAIELVDS